MIREARRAGVPLRAVSLDRDWALVRVLFGGDVPPEVVREPAGTLAPALGIENLPDSFAVDAAGRVVARFPSLAPDEVGRIDLDALGGTR
jgi:hypothetical protein